MTSVNKSPYICHVFVCTNDRGGTRRSCADDKSLEVRALLKQVVNDRGWRGRVRVSQCGCMGLCEKGPNVMLHPQQMWFSEVSPDDVRQIVRAIEATLIEDEDTHLG